MIQRNLCRALVLVMFRVFCLLKIMGAEFFDFPLANLSTSWTNNPFSSKVYVNTTSPYKVSFSPILYRGSSIGSQFMSGFYCQGGDPITANCFFGVLIFQRSIRFEDIFQPIEPQLVWSANRDHPVHIYATLNFTESGDLILKDTDGTSVWSTNTGGKNVVSLNLTTMGNIMLHSGDETSVWQSFDHLTDTLLPGQKLSLGQSITSSTSLYNFSRGSFSLIFESEYSLSAYTESSPPQSYMTVYPSELVREDQYLRYDNGTLRYKKALPSTTAEFMRLDADGHLKIYSWDGIYWKAAADVLDQYIDECGYPLVCGKYGICSSGSPLICSCPDEANSQTSYFRPINSRQPNLGCTSSIPISCSNPISHTLLQLKKTSYFSIDKYGLTKFTSKGKIKLEDCKNSCLRDCSCKAAFFVEKIVSYYSGLSYNDCLLVSEVFSLKNIDEYYGVQAFLKVEEAPNKLNSSTITSPRKRSNGMQIVVGSSVGAFLGAILLLSFFYFLLRNKNEIEELDEISFDHVPGMPTRFSYNDLKATTNNFFSKLGQGGFGTVFEGTLSDGTTVAVKRLDGLGHVKKSFLAEVESIGSIHHVNLVRLIGFCAEKSHRLLVYEYMPKGSLDNWIFQKNKELSLDWEARKKIILDVAKGLAYLHEDCRCKILHLDIKPQNILLDENFNAKVSDFGLAKLIDKDQSEVMTHLRGTPGYLAPEWLSSIITEKVDVYSFGIVVLEILCGRKNLDRSQPEEDMHLLTLFKRKAEEERMEDLADTCNENMQSHIAEIVKMMKIAKWCLQSDYSLRPSMSIVVRYIENSIDVESILGHEFTNLTISTTIAPSANPENAFGCVTLLPPISLSGPR